MRILVTVKRIPDPEENLKIVGNAVSTAGVKWVPNTFDEYAVETALRLSEQVGGSERLAEVVVLSVCPQAERQHVTQFLAMGADRGVVVDADDTTLDTQTVARAIAEVFRRESCDLLIAGKLSQDNEGNAVAQRVAGILNLPQACFAATVDWNRTDDTLTVGQEVDDGVEVKRIPLPAVVSVDLRVVLPHAVKNHATADGHAYQEGPRLASLRGITMAKRKKVDVLALGDLGLSPANAERSVAASAPPARKAGRLVGSVDELFEVLTKEAKVL